LYFQYSDDHRAWTKGQAEASRIQLIAQEVPLFLDMYRDYSNFMFAPKDEFGRDRPQLIDYLS